MTDKQRTRLFESFSKLLAKASAGDTERLATIIMRDLTPSRQTDVILDSNDIESLSCIIEKLQTQKLNRTKL